MMNQNEDEVLKAREIDADEQRRIRDKEVFGDERKLKFYEQLRSKVKQWSQQSGGKMADRFGEYLLLLPDLFVLVSRLVVDKRVPSKHKLFLGGVLTYLVLPIDIIPDFIPVVGHVDDLVLVVLALNRLLNDIDRQILLDNWSGEDDLLGLLQRVSATAENFLDKNILRKIKNWLGRR